MTVTERAAAFTQRRRPGPHAPGRNRATSASSRTTYAVLVVAVCSYALLQAMTVPAMPRIQAELHTDQATVSWVLTGFLISASVATPIAGRLGDAHGKKRVLVISLVLLAVGALLAALATTITVMLVARVVQGLAGGVLPLSFGIVRDQLPPARVPSAIALLSSLMSVGFATGIVLAGPLMELAGISLVFLLPMAAAAASAAVAVGFVRESMHRTRQPVRVMPAVVLAGWLVLLLVSVSRAPVWGWGSPRAVGGLVLAVLVLGLWVRIETTVRPPLIDLRLMTSRGVAPPNVVALLIGISTYGSFGFLPQFAQTPREVGYGFGVSVAGAGLLMLPTAVFSFLGGLSSTRIGARLGDRALVALGCWLTGAGLLVAAFAHDQEWQFLLCGTATGLGGGFCFAALANAVIAAAPAGTTGVVAGMNANLRTIGGAVGAATMATVLAGHLLPGGHPDERGYTVGFAVLAGSAVVAGVVALMTGARRPTGPSAPAPRHSRASAS